MKRQRIIIFGLIALLAIGGGTYWLVLREDVESEINNSTDETSEAANQTDDSSGDSSEDSADEPEPETNKSSTPPATVTEKPLVYTSAGHVPGAPVKSGQVVSTTCTSEPRVSCTLSFTNKSNSSQVITFDAMKTDSQGVAVWTWNPTTDVPSGTWKVVAAVGDKKSESETIYVQ